MSLLTKPAARPHDNRCSSRAAGGTWYAALRLDIGALISAGTGRREAGPANEKLFSLVIEGNEYVLDVVEVIFDPVFGMQHVLAAVRARVPTGRWSAAELGRQATQERCERYPQRRHDMNFSDLERAAIKLDELHERLKK